MILPGYNKIGGYKLFNPNNKQVVMSRNIVFDESKGWNWKLNTNEQSKKIY